MARNKVAFTQVGKTEDGRAVIGGVFKMYDTVGLPLSTLLDLLQDRKIQPCWASFYLDAQKGGWKDKTIESRLQEAIVDSYGRNYYEEWKVKLDNWKLTTFI